MVKTENLDCNEQVRAGSTISDSSTPFMRSRRECLDFPFEYGDGVYSADVLPTHGVKMHCISCNARILSAVKFKVPPLSLRQLGKKDAMVPFRNLEGARVSN